MELMDLKLCDIQGRLFELSIKKGYDSKTFVKCFMNSKVAYFLDTPFNHFQWAGEEYLLEELEDEFKDKLIKSDKLASIDQIYWIGYIYRYWHYYKNESSKKIYKKASYERMLSNYYMFHTMSPELAIDDLIEIDNQIKSKKKSK